MADKPEPRFQVDLVIRAFGMDAYGHPFSQDAHARDISDHGAKLSGFEKQLRAGDIIGVQFGEKRARCRVIWASDAGPVQKIQAGVKVLPGQPCPWQREREMLRATAKASRMAGTTSSARVTR